MGVFRRLPAQHLAAQMAGVKMGDRLLVIGCGDPALIAAVASKVGLSGSASAVDESSSQAAAAHGIVEREGALVEAVTSPYTSLPFSAEAFDLVIISHFLGGSSHGDRLGIVAEANRVLRPAGRCMVIEGTARTGWSRLLARPADDVDGYAASGGAERVLQAGGFAGVRTLAARDGMVFVEGIKSRR